MNRLGKFTLLLSLVALLLAPGAMAQCAMCYESASHAGPNAAKTLNWGIVTLLSPALLMFSGIVIFAVRRRTAAEEFTSE